MTPLAFRLVGWFPVNLTFSVQSCLPQGTKSPLKITDDWQSGQTGNLAPFPSDCTFPL